MSDPTPFPDPLPFWQTRTFWAGLIGIAIAILTQVSQVWPQSTSVVLAITSILAMVVKIIDPTPAMLAFTKKGAQEAFDIKYPPMFGRRR